MTYILEKNYEIRLRRQLLRVERKNDFGDGGGGGGDGGVPPVISAVERLCGPEAKFPKCSYKMLNILLLFIPSPVMVSGEDAHGRRRRGPELFALLDVKCKCATRDIILVRYSPRRLLGCGNCRFWRGSGARERPAEYWKIKISNVCCRVSFPDRSVCRSSAVPRRRQRKRGMAKKRART